MHFLEILYYLGRFGRYVPTVRYRWQYSQIQVAVQSDTGGSKLYMDTTGLLTSGQTMYIDTTGLLTSQNLSIAQTNLCAIFKIHVCVGGRVTGTLLCQLHVTVVLVTSVTNSGILLNDCRLLAASIRRPASSDRDVRYSSTGVSAFTRAA